MSCFRLSSLMQSRPSLSCQGRDDGAEIGVAAALPEAVDGALDLVAAQLHRGDGIRHGQLRVVVGVNAQGHAGKALLHRLDDLAQLGSEGAAVGVAQHQDLGPAVQGGLQRLEGVLPVVFIAVEKMLGVVKELLHPGLDIGQGVGDELQVALQGGLQDLLHLKDRGLAEDGHHRGPGQQQLLEDGVGLRRPVLVMGAAEGGDAALPQVVVVDVGEKLLVLGVGAGPAAFQVVNADLRQFLRNADLIRQGQAEVLGLGAVPQGGVVDFHLAHGLGLVKCQSSKFKVQGSGVLTSDLNFEP